MDFGKITVRDLGSRNGTLVNDEPVEETQLKAGDVLKIGPVEFVIQIDGVPASFEEYLPQQEEAPEQPEPKTPAPEPVADVNFDEAMEGLADVELGKSQTEMLGDLPDDFDFDDDFDL